MIEPDGTVAGIRTAIRTANDMAFSLYLDLLLDDLDYQITFVDDASAPALNAAHAVADTDFSLLTELAGLTRTTGIPFGVFEDPATPTAVVDRLEEARYSRDPRHDDRWYGMDFRTPGALGEVALARADNGIVVRELVNPTVQDIRCFVAVDALANDLSPPLADRLAESLNRPDRNSVRRHLFLATVDGRLAGCGALLMCRSQALLCEAGTMPFARYRGVHTRLVTRRLVRARELGADVVFGTSGANAPGGRTLVNAGMKALWLRRYWSPVHHGDHEAQVLCSSPTQNGS